MNSFFLSLSLSRREIARSAGYGRVLYLLQVTSKLHQGWNSCLCLSLKKADAVCAVPQPCCGSVCTSKIGDLEVFVLWQWSCLLNCTEFCLFNGIWKYSVMNVFIVFLPLSLLCWQYCLWEVLLLPGKCS